MLTAFFLSVSHAQVAERLNACAACHGTGGNSSVPGTPSIAGQPKVFLENYLVLTREGLRGNEAMRQLLQGASDREITALAVHFAKQTARPERRDTDNALFARGRLVAGKNRCGSCHRPDYRGREQMPRLASQREDFLLEVMIAYMQNRRPGGDTIMAASRYGIPNADLKALAHFLARLR